MEGQVRTLKHALEERIQRRIPSTHPVMKWLVQYASTLLNKYTIHEDNATAYQQLHGKRASERLADFGEQVLFWIPKARRAKLDKMWAPGIYLGTTMTSNEAYEATFDGNVTRARGISRVFVALPETSIYHA